MWLLVGSVISGVHVWLVWCLNVVRCSNHTKENQGITEGWCLLEREGQNPFTGCQSIQQVTSWPCRPGWLTGVITKVNMFRFLKHQWTEWHLAVRLQVATNSLSAPLPSVFWFFKWLWKIKMSLRPSTGSSNKKRTPRFWKKKEKKKRKKSSNLICFFLIFDEPKYKNRQKS